jgi:large subunit ribosomal protein L13
MQADKPVKLFESVIKGMLPKTRLKYQRKLKVYVGATHPHAAQTPVVLEV